MLRATFVADTKFVSETQKMFLIFVRNILCAQQMFPRLLAQYNIMNNNVSATMCPRLPPPIYPAQFDGHFSVPKFDSNPWHASDIAPLILPSVKRRLRFDPKNFIPIRRHYAVSTHTSNGPEIFG